MNVTNKITIHLDDRRVIPMLHAVQCDADTRVIEFTLMENNKAWTVPGSAAPSVAYSKPDGTSGWYDKLPGGAAACSVNGNIVTAILAEQVLTAWGDVSLALVLQNSSTGEQIASFPVTIKVHRHPAAGQNKSNNYYNYKTMGEVNDAIAALELQSQTFPAYQWVVATDYGGLTSNLVQDGFYLTNVTTDDNAWTDLPEDMGNAALLVFRYSPNYVLQVATSQKNGEIRTRIVNRNDHSVYRDWAPPDGTAPKKILCVGDSIARGYRNGGRGFVGDLGVPYKNAAISSTTLSNAYADALNIPAQLLAVTDYEPDVVIANGGINDYLRGAAMGTVPSARATADRWGTNPQPATVMDGLECLLYNMCAKYPDAECYFLLIHKVTRNGVDCTATANSAGYTQTQLFENIKTVCGLYGVGVIDVFGESCINTAHSEYVSPVKYSDDNSATYSQWVDADGLHPMAYGYLHGYVPIVRRVLRLGGDDAIDPRVIIDAIKGYNADNPYTMFRNIDDPEKYGRKTSNLTQDGAYFIYEPLWDDVPISKDGAATMLVAPYHDGRSVQVLIQNWNKTDRPLPVLTRLVNRSDGSVRRDWMASDGTRQVKILCIGDDVASGYRNDFKAFVGDLGVPYQKAAQAYATLSNAALEHNSKPIAELLESAESYGPGIVIACGGIHDYLYSVELGEIPAVAIDSDEAANALNRDTVMGGLQHLLYRMKAKYPEAEHYFLLMHKLTINGIDCTTTANKAGYTQTQLFENIKTVCGLYGVGIVDVFGESCINTAYPEFVSPVSWEDDPSVTHTQWVDSEGLRPLAYGYLHGYVPIVRKSLRLGGDNTVDPKAVTDIVGSYLASHPVGSGGSAVQKILSFGDSIAYGERNGFKGFVGDLGVPYRICAKSGATLASVKDNNVLAQLEAETGYDPDIVIAEGGINDYVRGVAMGAVPTAAVTTDAAAKALDTKTVMGALQCLLFRMNEKYPDAEHYFLLIHKVTQDGKDYTVTKNTLEDGSVGYTQTELFENIKAVCALYGVGIVDIFGESCINTAYPEFVAPVGYFTDPSVTYTHWVNSDGLHPLDYGYKHGYVPIVRKALKLGGDDVVDNQAIFDMVRSFLASRPLTINGRSYDGSEPVDVNTTSFVVNVSGSPSSGYRSDKTLDEIEEADNQGREIYCVVNNIRMCCTSTYGAKAAGVWGYTFTGINNGSESYVSIGTNGIQCTIKPLVPSALPNPQPIVINGQSYDGSEEVVLNIPGGSGEATGDFIPVPETAEIGQAIVVKAVDESGKPTEWEPKTDYPAYADPEGWEHIKTVTVTSSDNVWRLIINVDADGNKFAYDELILFTEDLAATSNSAGRIFINRLSPYQNYYANFSNFFVTNAQSGGTAHISILKRDLYNDEGQWSSTGHMYTFQSRSNTGFANRFRSNFDGSSGMNAWNSEEFAKKICSFGIQTSDDTVYMRGTFKLFGRNYK